MTNLPIVQNNIPEFKEIQDVHNILHERGCELCDLGFQKDINGCCVSRGTYHTTNMIIGEAPGKEEDSQGKPFTGPAGELLDRIWESVGLSTSDWYLTNVVKCRPVAPKGFGKQNLTPKADQRDRCKPFLEREIALLKPRIIVPVGGIATAAVMGLRSVRIGAFRGRKIAIPRPGVEGEAAFVFPMLHPAYLLHSKRDPVKYQRARSDMWEDIQKLKTIIDIEEL